MKKLLQLLLFLPLTALGATWPNYYVTNANPTISPGGLTVVTQAAFTVGAQSYRSNYYTTNVDPVLALPLADGNIPVSDGVGWTVLPAPGYTSFPLWDNGLGAHIYSINGQYWTNIQGTAITTPIRSTTVATNPASIGYVPVYNGTFMEWQAPTNVTGGVASNVFESAFSDEFDVVTNGFLYQIALAAGYKAGVTNLVTSYSTTVSNSLAIRAPQHVNMSMLYKSGTKLISSNKQPFRVMAIGDENSFPQGAMTNLINYLGRNGTLNGGGGTAGEQVTTYNANAWNPGDTILEGMYLGSTETFSMTNGGVVTFSRTAGSGEAGSGTTNFYCDTARLFLFSEPRGGTITVQTNEGGSTWGTALTVDASALTTNMIPTNVPLSGLAYRSIRVLKTADNKTNRIYGCSMYNSTTNGLSLGGFLVNAAGDWRYMADSETNVSWPFWSAMQPDVLVLYDNGPTNDLTALDQLEFCWTNVCPAMDVIYVGACNLGGDTGLGTANDYITFNKVLREKAIQYGRAFFDLSAYVPTNLYAGAPSPFFYDASHFSVAMQKFLNEQLWAASYAPWVNNPFNVPAHFGGKSATFLRRYLGETYGGHTNQGVVEIQNSSTPNFTFYGSDSQNSYMRIGDAIYFGGGKGIANWYSANGTYLFGAANNIVGLISSNTGWRIGAGNAVVGPGLNSLAVVGTVFGTNGFYTTAGYTGSVFQVGGGQINSWDDVTNYFTLPAGGNPFDQNLNTSDSPTFAGLTIGGDTINSWDDVTNYFTQTGSGTTYTNLSETGYTMTVRSNLHVGFDLSVAGTQNIGTLVSTNTYFVTNAPPATSVLPDTAFFWINPDGTNYLLRTLPGSTTWGSTNSLGASTGSTVTTNGFITMAEVANLTATNESRAVNLTNANNQFVGSFTGNGAGLTNLPSTAIAPYIRSEILAPTNSGIVPGALMRYSAAATGNGTNMWSSKLWYDGTSLYVSNNGLATIISSNRIDTTGSGGLIVNSNATSANLALTVNGNVNLSSLTASRVVANGGGGVLITAFGSPFLSNALNDETGSGSAVFANSPNFINTYTFSNAVGSTITASNVISFGATQTNTFSDLGSVPNGMPITNGVPVTKGMVTTPNIVGGADYLVQQCGVYIAAGTNQIVTLTNAENVRFGCMVTVINTNLDASSYVTVTNLSGLDTIQGVVAVRLGANGTKTNRVTLISDGQNWQ